MANADPIAALVAMRKHTGRDLSLLDRYESGERGAYRVEDESGRSFVLKLGPERRLRNAAATTARLRVSGYPAPAYFHACVVTGDTWCVLMEALRGEPMELLRPDIAVELLSLIEKQAGQALLPDEDVSILGTLLYGGEGYALHETMRRYSQVTQELLDYVVAIGKASANLEFPSTDIVHFDLNPKNVLVRDDQVTGIVDWEGTRAGDRAFDIATLLFYADEPETESILWPALLDLGGLERAKVYLAHMMLRQVDWSGRFHTESEVRRDMARCWELRSLLEQ